MTTPRALGALACAVALILVGCSPAEEPTPTPENSNVSATSSASASDDIYKQAEFIYRRIDEINNTHVYAGKYEPFPEELNSLAMDPYLGQLKDMYSEMARDKVILRGTERSKFEVRPYHDDLDSGADIVLRSCSDYRDTAVYRDGEYTGNAALRYERWYFKFDESRTLKLFGIKSKEVTECTLE